MHGKAFPIGRAEALKWAYEYESARRYIQRCARDRERLAQFLWIYCRFAELNPDQLIALKTNGYSDPKHIDDAENLLDRFVLEYAGVTDSTMRAISIAVRGFYTKNRRSLEKAGEVDYSTKKSQKKPSQEERFKLFNACYNPRDKVLIVLSCCSAITLEPLSALRFDMFEDDWMKQETPHISIDGVYIKGHDKGKFKGVRQETFCTPECKRLILEYRDWYTKHFGHIWRSDDPVFLDIKSHIGKGMDINTISSTVMAIADRAGVKFGVHDGRIILNTALQDVECDPNWIQMAMGRKVPGNKSPYTRPNIEQLRSKYQKALGELQFLGVGFKTGDDFSEEDHKIMKLIIEATKAGRIKFEDIIPKE